MSVNNVLFNILSPSFFFNVFLFGVLVSCTQFMLQVSDKFGPGILWKFLTGKYYHPRQEERIFMFLDLRSSTSIAEKMSSKKFFDLLKDVFQDITEPILNSQGEIYQYVGDEVVISWPVDQGLAGNNCLLCFFRIEQALEQKEKHYIQKYDVLPSFKAGLHIGEATVGEIGVIKKDIVYSGDVLNTASRIQGECNNQNVNILLSSDLLERMQLNGAYQQIALGEFPLKGKKERTTLYAITARVELIPINYRGQITTGRRDAKTRKTLRHCDFAVKNAHCTIILHRRSPRRARPRIHTCTNVKKLN